MVSWRGRLLRWHIALPRHRKSPLPAAGLRHVARSRPPAGCLVPTRLKPASSADIRYRPDVWLIAYSRPLSLCLAPPQRLNRSPLKEHYGQEQAIFQLKLAKRAIVRRERDLRFAGEVILCLPSFFPFLSALFRSIDYATNKTLCY